MNRLYASIVFGLSLVSCKPSTSTLADSASKAPIGAKPSGVFKIAFGSCGDQSKPLPIFHEVIKHKPDLFVFLGDNIYGDTNDMEVLRQKYQQLGNQPSFQALKKNMPIEATWDDHDYGQNDVGKNYPHKQASKEIFLDFFAEPKNSARFKRDGIYAEKIYQVGGKKIQLILLDGRTFRDDLLKTTKKTSFYHWDYIPHSDTSKTLLGEKQWRWLEKTLQQPADCRILATGTQFGIEANGYEAWANFPHEQERLVKLIKKTRANHLVAISGDVHYAEISKFQNPHSYPIYDITASGLSKKWRFATSNKNRIEGPVMKNHFGLLTINFSTTRPNIKAEIWDANGNQRIEYTIPLQDIRFDSN